MVQEVQQRQGGGADVGDGTRSQMEGYFGADLGDVRVHAVAADVHPADLRTGRVTAPVSPHEFDQLDAQPTEPS